MYKLEIPRGARVQYFAIDKNSQTKHFWSTAYAGQVCDTCGSPATRWLSEKAPGTFNALLPLCEEHAEQWQVDLEWATTPEPDPDIAAFSRAEMQLYLDRVAAKQAVLGRLLERVMGGWYAQHPEQPRDPEFEATALAPFKEAQQVADDFRRGLVFRRR